VHAMESFLGSYGYSADNILEMQVVVPGDEAEVVTVNNVTNSDLFWAMLGGGPGFGIVLSVTMQMHKAPPKVWVLTIASSDPTPLCPGLAESSDQVAWLTESAKEISKSVLFNAMWWELLPN